MNNPDNKESKLQKELEKLQTRLELLSRISSNREIEDNNQLMLKNILGNISHLINTELPNLAKKSCPKNFPEILNDMQYRFEEFSYFCFYPELGKKNVIGIGGGFSAGKSSFINRLLNEKFLVVNINPTTSIPTYLHYGEEENIIALNIFQNPIKLTQEEFKTFTHKEEKKYKTNFGKMLEKVNIQIPTFKWENLAILDTPGYSKAQSQTETSDIEIARQQLKSVDYLIWIISSEKGTITEDDILFLSELNPDIPRIILINKADKKPPEEIKNISQLVKEIAFQRNLKILDVIPICSHFEDNVYPINKVLDYLNEWNNHIHHLDFMIYFKKPFYQYFRYLLQEKSKLKEYIKLMNNISWEVKNQSMDYTHDIKEKFKTELEIIENTEKELKRIEDKFFQEIQKISIHLKIPFFEPHYFEFAEPETCGRLVSILETMLNTEKKRDYTNIWQTTQGDVDINRVNHILQQLPIKNYPQFNHLK